MDGTVVPYNNWQYTDFIKVDQSANGKIIVKTLRANKTETADGYIYNGWYDKNKNYIGRLTLTNGELTIPLNAVYIRLSNRSAYEFIVQLYANGTVDIAESGETSIEKDEYLKFVTWNVGIFSDGTNRPTTAQAPEQIAKFKRAIGKMDADIINTQEYAYYVDDGAEYPSANLMDFKYGGKFGGNGTYAFSKVPTANSETIVFNSGSNRPCYAYEVEINGKTVTIINTHLSIELDSSVHRDADIQQLITYMNNKEYVILTGDFNISSDAELNAFKTAGYTLCNGGDFGWFDTWPVFENMWEGFSTDWPTYHLDNIVISSNIIPQYVEAFECNISDHAPLIAILKID
jgi:endonuclease/exonuclease/phosphatase family metal-dependent hydrolase